MYINIRMHMHPYWKLLDPPCSWSGYRPCTAPPFASPRLDVGELSASPQTKGPRQPINMELGGSLCQSGCFVTARKFALV